MAVKSNLLNLLGLLKSIDKFAVPTIQRDYAQGRDKGSNKDLCEEVREGLIDSLYNALADDKFFLLDYIYGTHDSNVFYPIDGQQRLTTLFLLHWYIGKKEGINKTKPTDFNQLKKFSYEIRDTSKEFCKSLIEIDVAFDRATISDQIKDSSKYHDTYSYDPTVLSMLTVLDTIHRKFKDVKEQLWDRLEKIEFWSLSLEGFGLTDDLFVKMNARGKRLSRFDVFKSDLEAKLEKIVNTAAETWKREIDNAFLDAYWKEFGAGLSEKNLFRTILFYAKTLILAKNSSAEYADSWEADELMVDYSDVIAFIEKNANALECICNLLSNFDAWESYVKDTGLFVKDSSAEWGKIAGYNRVIIFGILHWFSFSNNVVADSNFFEFKRILENYVFSLRQPNITPTRRFYSSSIDNRSVGKYISFLKGVIDGYDRTGLFNDYVSKSTFAELDYEREKLAYKSLKDIVELENVPLIKRNINNFFFGETMYLSADDLQVIANDADLVNKSLRIIYSYAKDKYGKFSDLLMDETLIKSGHRQLYYRDDKDQATAYMHKLSFKADDAFGDRIFTASGSGNIYEDISKCVRKFAEHLSQKLKVNPDISKAVNDLLSDRLLLSDFKDCDNVKWYIVKYEEFFYSKTSTTLSVLRRKNYGGIDDDNVYDMQCLNDNNNFFEEHYHPFYQALANKLNNKITVISPLRYTRVQIEYAHPCTLSNGWTIRINKNGNWSIDFKGNKLPPVTENLTIAPSGLGELNCSKKDSIATMAAFLNSL